MVVTEAQLSVPRRPILGYRLLNESSWMNLAKVSPIKGLVTHLCLLKT